MKGHLGIQKTVKELRRKYYFPGFIEYLISYINICQTCLQAKSPNHNKIQLPLNPVNSNTSFPADIMQIDIVGPLPKSGGFSYILTGTDIFSKYMFAQTVNSISAATVTKFLFQWFLQHCYIPLLIITDQGSQFTSQILHELADLLEIKFEHATLKHALTIGVVERSPGPLKRYLSIYENQLQHDWLKYIDLAVFQNKTSYHTTNGCPPSLIFHGQIPINSIDLWFNKKSIYHKKCNIDYIADIQIKMATLFSQTKASLVKSFHKYRDYNDKKATAAPLKLYEYCVLLHPKLSNEHEKISNLQYKWSGQNRIEKILTRSNYLIRKVNTLHTQLSTGLG